MSLAEPISVTLELVEGLEALGLSYVVGGSVASSLHGIPRATQDIDVVVVLWGKDVDGFVARFESSFYVDRDMVMDAIRRRASFNIIHLATTARAKTASAWVLSRYDHPPIYLVQ